MSGHQGRDELVARAISDQRCWSRTEAIDSSCSERGTALSWASGDRCGEVSSFSSLTKGRQI